MQSPVAFEVLYSEHQRQVAWVNDNEWQFAKPRTQYRVRQAMARALVQLANLLTPGEATGTAHPA